MGRPSIPIGMVKGSGVTPEDSPMIRVPVQSGRYPHKLKSGADAPDAVAVLRQALSAQPDHSVVIVQVGFSTNLAHLLDDSGLVARKVKLLVMMAGDFAKRNPEYNIKMDIPSAQRLFRDWPTPIVVSGFEIGNSMLFPASSITRDFPANHPVADAYKNYKKFPYDRRHGTSPPHSTPSGPTTVIFHYRNRNDRRGQYRRLNAAPIGRWQASLSGDERRAARTRTRSDDPAEQ